MSNLLSVTKLVGVARFFELTLLWRELERQFPLNQKVLGSDPYAELKNESLNKQYQEFLIESSLNNENEGSELLEYLYKLIKPRIILRSEQSS
jgi:hypothetical protein